jgi:hypothetical protein
MALYDPVDGVYRKVAKKYDPVGGVYRNVKAAYDPVDGVYRQYFSGGGPVPASELAVGDGVWLNVDGVLTEFLVVHQGNPDSAMYDASCDGTWVLAKDIYQINVWDADEYDDDDGMRYASSDYSQSNIRKVQLEYNYKNSIDQNVAPFIKQVKLPYAYGKSNQLLTGKNGIPAYIFLLSSKEVGYTQNSSPYSIWNAGVCLDYFAGATDATRVAYYNGSAKQWWLRTPQPNNTSYINIVQVSGSMGRDQSSRSNGVRPAFILDSNTLISKSDGKYIIE